MVVMVDPFSSLAARPEAKPITSIWFWEKQKSRASARLAFGLQAAVIAGAPGRRSFGVGC
jgi:hypothetical protein